MEFPVLEHGNQPRLQLGISDGNAWGDKAGNKANSGFSSRKNMHQGDFEVMLWHPQK
jgi:hypothetical protein